MSTVSRREAQIHFYALTEDILPVLAAIEGRTALKYTRMGNFETKAIDEFHSGGSLPNVGIANNDSAINCDTFLVSKAALHIEIRVIADSGNKNRYCVDQLLNPDTVTFSSGGSWDARTILYGRLATVSDSTTAQELMGLFRKGIRGLFGKVKSFYVGPRALDVGKNGGRLTPALQCPPNMDLKV
jgi:hypothetical protein